MDAVLIPIFVPLGFFAMIFGIYYLHNSAKMAMIERGMDPRIKNKQTYNRNYTLTAALLLIGAGVGLFIADRLSLTMPVGYDPTAIYMALIALFAGLGLFSAYLIEKNDAKKEKGEGD